MDDEYLGINRANWDSRVPVHSAAYDLDAYRRDPDHISSVVRFDLPRLSPVSGLDVVHLQCHIGTDTLSLARLGARMTGLDFSTPRARRSQAPCRGRRSGHRVRRGRRVEASAALLAPIRLRVGGALGDVSALRG